MATIAEAKRRQRVLKAATVAQIKGSLTDWATKHRDHGRAGPWRDATIGEYHRVLCSCGEAFTWTNEQATKYPELYAVPAGLG